ncbi:hypothetical protein MtrunA17_Chr3g0083931 [Medicago truncatula]|uniref:Uncharacterized protein n=1 Tax=Medicago truncatula TaxID=3880 RepID=A0A396IJN9_MEDTR|nr:hypothetical protein MtrunA17_Chr3g0083931 [Medicago truncatula]
MVKDKHVGLWELGRNIESIKKASNLVPHMVKDAWEGINKIIKFGINDKNNVDKPIL